MGIKVPRTRAGGKWTEARYWSFIRSALRGAWQRYPVKHDVKLTNRREAAGKVAHRYEYQCATCADWFPDKNVQVDHIQPAGSLRSYDDLPMFVRRLFCEPENLQILCKPCHLVKTNQEREDARQARQKP